VDHNADGDDADDGTSIHPDLGCSLVWGCCVAMQTTPLRRCCSRCRASMSATTRRFGVTPMPPSGARTDARFRVGMGHGL
jgi:hypothetical protein